MNNNSWGDLVICKNCGSDLNQKDTDIICVNCGKDHSSPQKWSVVTDGKLLHDPSILGQVPAPSEYSNNLVKEFCLPDIQDVGIDLNNLRILETGTGAGSIAYCFGKVVKPLVNMYTNTYVQLMGVLSTNLDQCGLMESVGWAVGLNTGLGIDLLSKKINVVIGHSVLHHVLDYRTLIKHLKGLLDAFGVMQFAESLRDGWVYFLKIVSLLIDQADIFQQILSVGDLRKVVPRHFVFDPVLDTQQGIWDIRLFIRDVECSIRVVEWSRYSWGGFGKLKTRAFSGFDFS